MKQKNILPGYISSFSKRINAKTGIINTIIVKDLSRFDKNYIEVGQFIDYVFSSFGIKFIVIQDNVDTEKKKEKCMFQCDSYTFFNIDSDHKIRCQLLLDRVLSFFYFSSTFCTKQSIIF